MPFSRARQTSGLPGSQSLHSVSDPLTLPGGNRRIAVALLRGDRIALGSRIASFACFYYGGHLVLTPCPHMSNKEMKRSTQFQNLEHAAEHGSNDKECMRTLKLKGNQKINSNCQGSISNFCVPMAWWMGIASSRDTSQSKYLSCIIRFASSWLRVANQSCGVWLRLVDTFGFAFHFPTRPPNAGDNCPIKFGPPTPQPTPNFC